MTQQPTKGVFADKLPGREPTLAELAQIAIDANLVESEFLFSDAPADQWQGAGDRRDIDLHETAQSALDQFCDALASQAGIDRKTLNQIGALL